MSRPEILFSLFAELESLSGIGPKTAQNLTQLGINTPRDLLFTLPYSGIDRKLIDTVKNASFPSTLTVLVKVSDHRPPHHRSGAYRVDVDDAKTSFQLIFFHGRSDYLNRVLPKDSTRVVSGKVEIFDGVIQMTHPEYIVSESEISDFPAFEPIYPLTSGVNQKTMFKATRSALTKLPIFNEWIDLEQKTKANWPDFLTAFQKVHSPESLDDIAMTSPARTRIAYDELLAHQLTLSLARAFERRILGRESHGNGRLQALVSEALPYTPTDAQQRSILEISQDMASDVKMNRLLQGDVGTGKTLVAFWALLIAVEAGGQGVMMAPTEILARQHLESLQPLAEKAGVVLELLTGRDKGAKRRAKLEALWQGNIQILVGTHAVFQTDVQFADLRLAIVDEQHRFGVRQRLMLGKKGQFVDVLVMTATPIPRSLALAQYGDMDISTLDEKPPGRKPIKTALISTSRMNEVIERLRAAVADGRQCYWVCPLVEESEVVDLTAAEDRFVRLRAALGDGVVGLVHGQMPAVEKDKAMTRFQTGDTGVLVATTVIEVGVNVPNATIMVIERAEVFGLAQLHQLRGRVGRGLLASTCLLMYQAPLSKSGQRRLEILRETEDGFRIAETDLKMRGFGDLIGTEQSGVPQFKVAEIERQGALMAVAHSDARKLLLDDPALKSPRGRAARNLLWLMGKDESIRLISVG